MTKKRISTLFGAALGLVALSAEAAPTLRYQADIHGSFLLVGNTLGQDCASGTPAPVVGTLGACGTSVSDSSPDVFWESDLPAAGQAQANTGITAANARSTAVLTLPAGATVTYARLYWAAVSSTTAADASAVLDRPGVFTTGALPADVTRTTTVSTHTLYESSADVTSIVKQYGTGAYRVSDVDSMNFVNLNDSVPFASWSLVVLYDTATDPLRQVSVFDALDIAGSGAPVNLNINGFLVPNTGIDASLGIVAYGGDTTGGSSLTFNGTALTDGVASTTKFFNASRTLDGVAVSTAGDLPQLTGGFGSGAGIDSDIVNVTSLVAPGSTSASLSMKTGSLGNLTLGIAVTAITTFKPNFNGSVKTATDLNGGSIVPGDVIRYTVDVTNTGNDPGIGVVFTDAIPAGVSFVPGSIQVVSGPNSGAKTDAADSDQGEYVAGTNTVRIRLGTGANGTVGGTLGIGAVSTVQFDVMVGSLAIGTISNQAVITAAGQNGAPTAPYTSANPTGGSTTDIVVSACEKDADCPAADPKCLLSGDPKLPNVCVKCLTNANCSGTTPVCDSNHNCVPCSSDTDCTNPATPACQAAGTPLAGACAECSVSNSTLCGGSSPQCLTAIGQCGCSDTDGDSECGGPTSGVICNGPAGICVPGCSTAVNRNNCPGTQVCSKLDGTVGTCSPQTCNNDGDCSLPTPRCNKVPVTHICVQCLGDPDCGAGLICDLSNNTCVQCTPTQTGNCSAGGSGSACLPNGTCGCTVDSDCGAATSGRVCDTVNSVCITGCRGTGGNTCPSPLVCTSTDGTIGSCVNCTSNANCAVPTPLCASNNLCVECITFADCPSTAPVCNGAGQCVGCTSNTDCKDPAKPACNTAAGALFGACTECTDTTLGLCNAAKPQCLPTGVCGCSDTDGDSECGSPTSGKVCSGPAGTCIDGCAIAPSRNDCPATGYCSDRTGAVGTCLAQCATSSDCTTAPNVVCDTGVSPHVCVECVANTDCATGTVCDTSAHKCVGCVTSSDCGGTTPICNTNTQTCVGCLINANCATGQVCDPNTLTCVGCVTTADCPSPLVCDPTTQTCVGCLTTTDCTGAAVCSPTQTCVQCVTNADCTAPDVCDTTKNTCVRCLGNTDCAAPTPVCDTSVPTCVGCLANTDCSGTKPVCDTTAKVCVGCTTNANCSGTTPICNTTTGTCVGCTKKADCTGNMVCNTTTNQCVGCTTDLDCTGGFKCDTASTTCVQCLADTDCPTNQVCNANKCVECGSSANCASNPNGTVCQQPSQTCGCNANKDCASGSQCDTAKHVCVASKPNTNSLEGGGCACSLSEKSDSRSPFSMFAGVALAGLIGLRRRTRRVRAA